jgi:2-polyprenyl-6-methoxyphenol hydroxylase-like FAD-dependent oxidoreductase
LAGAQARRRKSGAAGRHVKLVQEKWEIRLASPPNTSFVMAGSSRPSTSFLSKTHPAFRGVYSRDGPVLLFADAAHAMYPTGSNGGSQATVDARDARVLGAVMVEVASQQEALSAFWTRVKPAHDAARHHRPPPNHPPKNAAPAATRRAAGVRTSLSPCRSSAGARAFGAARLVSAQLRRQRTRPYRSSQPPAPAPRPDREAACLMSAVGSIASFRTRDADFRFALSFGRIAASQRSDALGQKLTPTADG